MLETIKGRTEQQQTQTPSLRVSSVTLAGTEETFRGKVEKLKDYRGRKDSYVFKVKSDWHISCYPSYHE